jgi:purine-binding chemotaxis protein CheW
MASKMQLVVFNMGKEQYGVSIGDVQEIVRLPEVTEIPDAPPFLAGVINLRGRVIPVVDLRRRLRMPGKEKTKSTRVLVTHHEESSVGLVGLLVDSVSEVRRIQSDTIEEPPEMVSAVGIEYITGVAKVNERLIILLDLKRVLSVEDMKRVDISLEGAGEPRAA